MNIDDLIKRLNDVSVALSWDDVKKADQQVTAIITELVNEKGLA